jgi:uncharacterized protein DUF1839
MARICSLRIVAMTIALLDLDAATYQRSPLHESDRVWVETNCYVDVWIEMLHALGIDPRAGCAFTLSIDFDDDQFTFFKFPLEDLRFLWGVEVHEMNPWRPLDHHVELQLAKGRLMTIEVDSFFLPDTAGTSYQTEHVKTSIAPQLIDRNRRRLGYFHGQGYWELSGDDYSGVFRLGRLDAQVLPPYTELIKLDRLERPDDQELLQRAITLTRQHLARRRPGSITRFRSRFPDDLTWLRSEELATFHLYAFATLRQLGSAAELAGSFTEWLTEQGQSGLVGATADFATVAMTAKSMQFTLARAAAGRDVNFAPMLDELARAWDGALTSVTQTYGG